MTVAENRYLLEHRWLPHWFFEQKEALVGALLTPETHYLYEVMKRACEDIREAMPYQRSDYRSDRLKLSPTVYGVRVHLPQPEVVPHCYRIYLLFDAEFTQQAYFTIEYGAGGKYLCRWHEEGQHLNYGIIPDDLAEELAQVLKHFGTQ